MNKIRSTEENVGIPQADRKENLLEWLYQLRDRQRQHQRQGAWLIKGRDLPWENNRQGKMKWFLHPALDNTSIRSMIVFEQEIPPGGRSGAGILAVLPRSSCSGCASATVVFWLGGGNERRRPWLGAVVARATRP